MTAPHLAPPPVPARAAGPVPNRPVSPLAAALDAALTEVAAAPISGARRWWVTTKGDGIELHSVWAPHIPAPVLRATRVATGTALLAARLAVAVSGSRPVTTLLPGERPRGVLAIVRCGTVAEPTRAERALFDALARARRPGRVAPVALAMPLLRSPAEAEGAWLRTVIDPADGDRLRGLPPGDPAGIVPPGGLLAVLGSHGELPQGDIRAGQALQRVLCTARALGVAVSVLAGPVDLPPGGHAGLMPQVLVQVTPTEALTRLSD